MYKLIYQYIWLLLNRNKSPGVLLLFATVISLLLANSPIGEEYIQIFHHKVDVHFMQYALRMPIEKWINDGLMSLFFLLVGLEIKREIIHGELSTMKKAMLPIISAIGGVLVPALIYLLFNFNTKYSIGWGIPMATDIAFALSVLRMASPKLRSGPKVFLTALAIIDDLIAVMVIVLFYNQDIHLINIAYALIPLSVLIILNLRSEKRLILYLIPGIILWFFIHYSGIHTTLAGIIFALMIPIKTKGESMLSPLERMEKSLSVWVTLVVLPLFALCNTAIRIDAMSLPGANSLLITGIILGLYIGKPVGIYVSTNLAVRSGICSLPSETGMRQILGMGMLGGIGFTMSIFIAGLAFGGNEELNISKIAILMASCLSAITGMIYLRRLDKVAI